VYLAEITDYTEADVKQVFTEETGKEAQEVKIVGAGNPRPELRAVVNKRLQDSGFVITRDWPEARQKGGVRMIFRVLDDRAATKLQAEGAATVFLVPVVGFLSAAKKEARVVMTLEVYGPANDLMWSGRQKKVWKSDFFGGIFRKKAKLRAGATGDCIKLLLAKYDEWIHAQPQGEASEAAQQTTLEKPAAEEKPARTKPSRAKRGPKENPPGSPEH
jgi:hypothetical protein